MVAPEDSASGSAVFLAGRKEGHHHHHHHIITIIIKGSRPISWYILKVGNQRGAPDRVKGSDTSAGRDGEPLSDEPLLDGSDGGAEMQGLIDGDAHVSNS